MQAGIERVRHQHRVVDRRHRDAMTRENLGVIFHVLADFQHRRVRQQRLQRGQNLVQPKLALGQFIRAKQIIGPALLVTDRNIARLARHHAQRDADQLGAHLVKRCGLGIDRHVAPFARQRRPARQGFHRIDALI